MKKIIPIYIYGAMIILAGILLLFSKECTFNTIHLTLGVLLSVAALFAFISAISRIRKQVQFAYHEMHALTIFLYGIYILVYSTTLDRLISVTAFLFIFYLFSEIIFCNWLFNIGNKIVYKIIVIRALLGLAIGVGAIVAVEFPSFTLEIFGILFILVGTNIMLYVPVMNDTKSINETYSTN